MVNRCSRSSAPPATGQPSPRFTRPRWVPESRDRHSRGARARVSAVGPAGRPEPTTSGWPRWAGAFDGPSRPGGTARKLHQRVAVGGGCSRARHSPPRGSWASPCLRPAWRTSRGWGWVRVTRWITSRSARCSRHWSTVACPSVPPDPPAMASTGSTDPRPRRPCKAFKAAEHLGFEEFGDVGPGTMRRLNELFPGAGPAPTPPPPSPPPITPDDQKHKDAFDDRRHQLRALEAKLAEMQNVVLAAKLWQPGEGPQPSVAASFPREVCVVRFFLHARPEDPDYFDTLGKAREVVNRDLSGPVQPLTFRSTAHGFCDPGPGAELRRHLRPGHVQSARHSALRPDLVRLEPALPVRCADPRDLPLARTSQGRRRLPSREQAGGRTSRTPTR